MLIDDNVLLSTDSYKFSHFYQYPPGTSHVYSFFESRGGVFPEVVFFGLQYYLKRYLEGRVVTQERVDEARHLCRLHMGNNRLFNEEGWQHILRHHGGRLPVEIRAVPEGTVVPTSNVLMTIENTDPACWWLTNYLETLLSMIWYPCTVATQSRAMRRVILDALVKTGDPSLIDFKLHDFGFRGSTSTESAGIGGAAHLLSFKGTDTVAALRVAQAFYHEPMAGFSIPAAEHSTITSWGRENEVAAFRNMLEKFPTGLVAVVSDSYDIFAACRDLWGSELKDKVMARDGTLVVRPDSGDPPQVVCEVLQLLAGKFGSTDNEKGFRVLNPRVRVIQGDGIDYQMLGAILDRMTGAGWSADNVAFGSGGGLLQKVNRDTQKFAFKCSAVQVYGEWRDVMKDPVTDRGKKSKAGRLALRCDNGRFHTEATSVAIGTRYADDCLRPVFHDGTVLVDQNFSIIRKRAGQ